MSSLLESLSRFHEAASKCAGHALAIIRKYGRLPENAKPKDWMHKVKAAADKLEAAVAECDKAHDVDALSVIDEGIGTRLPPMLIKGLSYLSAHEAAHALAEAVLDTVPVVIDELEPTEAAHDAAQWAALLRALEVPDMYARLQGEYLEAVRLVKPPGTADDAPHELGADRQSKPARLKRQTDMSRSPSESLLDRLYALNQAAGQCASAALEFVERYRETTEPTIDSYSISLRAEHRLRNIEASVDSLRDDIAAYEEAATWDIIETIGRAIDGRNMPFISVGGKDYLTAHEAAGKLAQAVISATGGTTFGSCGEVEGVRKICQRLQDFGNVPNLDARLEAEYFAAERSLWPPDEEPVADQHKPAAAGAKPRKRKHAKKPQDAFREVRELVNNELRGGQRRLVEVLLEEGRVPIGDVGIKADIRDANRTKAHVNEKLLVIGWEIGQHDNEWLLRRV
jgi:hypothetical protein